MGLCISEIKGLFKKKDSKSMFVTVFPTQLGEAEIDAVSERHNDKFYFIPNEDEVDQAIEYLDEDGPSESNYQDLNGLLQKLKQLQKRYNPDAQNTKSNPDAILEENEYADSNDDHFERKNILAESQQFNTELSESQSSRKDNENNGLKAPIQLTFSGKKQVKEGELILEIQAGKFLHEEFLSRNNLLSPYIQIKIYRYQHTAKYLQNINEIKEKGQVYKTFETVKNEDPITPIWAHIIHQKISDEDIIKNFFIGVCLFYTVQGKSTPLMIGEELFSLSSFLDQRLQTKEIDYRNPAQKGNLAKIRVRFQLIYLIQYWLLS